LPIGTPNAFPEPKVCGVELALMWEVCAIQVE
jgi:hypothetical protein